MGGSKVMLVLLESGLYDPQGEAIELIAYCRPTPPGFRPTLLLICSLQVFISFKEL